MVFKINPERVSPVEIEGYIPVGHARQTTEVFMQDNKLKMHINKTKEPSAMGNWWGKHENTPQVP